MTPSAPRYRFEVLHATHPIAAFHCGNGDVDAYLQEDALEDVESGRALTFVLIDVDEPATANVAGFFTLRTHAAFIDEAYFGEDEDLGNHDTEEEDTLYQEVPLIELMCLGRDRRWKGRGIGDTLMVRVLSSVAEVSRHVGFIGLHLRSTEEGIRLYESYDFQPFPAHKLYDTKRYILPIDQIRAIAERIPRSFL